MAHHLGDHQEALTRYREALVIFRDLDFTYMEADVLECLGGCHAALGDLHSADREWRHALRLYDSQHRAANADRVRRSLEKHAWSLDTTTGRDRRVRPRAGRINRLTWPCRRWVRGFPTWTNASP